MNNNVNSVKMSAKDAAMFLGITTNLLGVWRFRKIHLSFEKIGKSIKYNFSELEKFKESCHRSIDDAER